MHQIFANFASSIN